MAEDGKPAKKQHEPTAAERDEKVSLYPEKGEDVLKRLLAAPKKPKRN